MKGHTLIRSAHAPETIETAVAQKTIWKNQSEATEYPVSAIASTFSAPSRRASSSAEGL